jgi:hypothetical protein
MVNNNNYILHPHSLQILKLTLLKSYLLIDALDAQNFRYESHINWEIIYNCFKVKQSRYRPGVAQRVPGS